MYANRPSCGSLSSGLLFGTHNRKEKDILFCLIHSPKLEGYEENYQIDMIKWLLTVRGKG